MLLGWENNFTRHIDASRMEWKISDEAEIQQNKVPAYQINFQLNLFFMLIQFLVLKLTRARFSCWIDWTGKR